MGRCTLTACWTCLAAAALRGSAGAQEYRIERIASGLSQPTYVTQAPGDPANVLYFTERTSDTIPGFGATNKMGKVWRYDVNTRTKTPVLDLSHRTVVEDAGLQTIAFGPDFNTPGTSTYHKMYVASAERGGPAVNRVEEYTLGGDGTFGSRRVVLEYVNNTQNNHTVNWVGFDPGATGAARNHLYVSTGDGSFASAYIGGVSPGKPSQDPGDVKGKLLRVDVAGPDAYPSDPLKNFAVPADNPIPRYNAAHPAAPIAGLGEVYVTGIRNASRVSVDRANGDIYMGDVGEFRVEEINFLRAGANPDGPPVDLGWPQREGTQGSGVPGAPQTTTNPFTGVTSLEPVRQFNHFGGGNAAIGGYVYRGPVASLRGKFFYADYVSGRIWQLEFDRDTDPSAYNGNNGTLAEVTSLWNALVIDPNDPNYRPDPGATPSQPDLFGIDHLVSFGEDNAGNLYVVDFGQGFGFPGQYPGPGLGEIFRITPVPEPGAAAALAAAALLILRPPRRLRDFRSIHREARTGGKHKPGRSDALSFA